MPDTTTPAAGTTPADDDATFWSEQRARDAADRGHVADPSACGTCRDRTAHGQQVEHEPCAQRATLLPAPDAPGYELLTYQTKEEAAALPARFHIPVFLDDCTPKAWVCAVCTGDGWTTAWPCPTAQKHGVAVFTPEYRAEQDRARRAAELFDLRARVAQLETAAAETGALKPVGYHCDHSDEPYGSRTHHGWEWDEENGGHTWKHMPNTISANTGLDQAYLKPEDRDRRCPRATLVYVATPAPAGAEERPGTVEYGIRIPAIGDWPSVVLPSHGDLAESTDRLARYLDSWPGAVLAVRTVAYGEWATAPVADTKTPAGDAQEPGQPEEHDVFLATDATVTFGAQTLRLTRWTAEEFGDEFVITGVLRPGREWPTVGDDVPIAQLGLPGRGLLLDITGRVTISSHRRDIVLTIGIPSPLLETP